MEDEFVKEKIGLLKTEMNLLWSSFFITFGGSLAIIMNLQFGWQFILSVFGFVISLVFANGFIIKRTEAVKMINYLNGEQK